MESEVVMKKLISLGFFILLIVGCATTDDPRQGGLFRYDPEAYEKRLEQRRQNLEALQQNQQHEKKKSQDLERDVQTKQVLMESERERIRLLDNDLTQLEENINKYQAKTNSQRAEKQRLGREIKWLQRQIIALRHDNQLAQAAKEKGIENIKREKDELEKLLLQLPR
jgi:chromosome segregation ATPase